MDDCEGLAARLQSDARDYIHLAVIAEAVQVSEMFIDLAVFREEQASLAAAGCESHLSSDQTKIDASIAE